MESSPDALAFRGEESKDSVLIRAAKDISFGSVSLLSLSVALVVGGLEPHRTIVNTIDRGHDLKSFRAPIRPYESPTSVPSVR